MPAYFRIRLAPDPEYGYQGRSWAGIAPGEPAARAIFDITTDRAYDPVPGFPAGSVTYRYPYDEALTDTRPEPAWTINWLIEQYVPTDGPDDPVSFKLRFGMLPETPVLAEQFDIGISIDGIAQGGAEITNMYSDGAFTIVFDAAGFSPSHTYRVSLYDGIVSIDEPDPGATAFWTALINAKEII